MENNDENNKQNDQNEILGQIFFKKYHCIEKLGQGSFGSIYKAEYNGNYYALKFEKKENNIGILENEAIIMNYLKGPHIPYVNSFSSNSNYNILVMQLLGKSLENIFEEKKVFSVKTVCMLGYQFVSILEYIHNRHIIHRDIKPDNFVMGLNDLSQYVYILDFGLAKKYRSSRTLEQFPFVNRRKITGTARYASINALRGYEQSRRDDLESVGYVLIYFLKGKLPWMGIEAKTKEQKYKKILQKKIDIPTKDLCEYLPEEMEIILDYVKNLEYKENPDYEMLRRYFNSMIRKEHSKFDYIYDWTTHEDRSKRKVISSRSDLDSTQNRKSTFATYKNNYDSRDDNNDYYLTIRKNNNNNGGNNLNNNMIIEENEQNNDIVKTSNKIKEEENIIISKRRNQRLDYTNNEDENICCIASCNIF
jgi:serine/threonine protein kinase